MGINLEYLGTPSGILKIAEIVFVIISFGIFRGVPVGFADEDANYFGGGVLVACLIITPLLLTCYLMNRMEIQGTILEMTLNFLFFLFLFAVSVRSYVYWGSIEPPPTYNTGTVTTPGPNLYDNRDAGLALASFTLFSSLAYMCDIPFSAKNFKEAYDEGGF